MDNMHLIVGLGNPGARYASTRHNAGFMALERLARRCQVEWKNDRHFKMRSACAQIQGQRVMLCLPQTYMNLCGEAVAAAARYYGVSNDRLLVVVDDADLPLGGLRLREHGGSGGHHGLESIQLHLAAENFARLRLGIGRNPAASQQLHGHVLSQFGQEELELLDAVLERAVDQIECWLTVGVKTAMNRFNGTIATPG